MITRLDPPLYLITPKGEGLAHMMVDYGPEHSFLWVVFQEDGQVWTWRNEEVRAPRNLMMGRVEKPAIPGRYAVLKSTAEGMAEAVTEKPRSARRRRV